MGGEITVASEPGRGSTFAVRLPADVAQIREGLAEAAGSAGMVLVIDDEAVVRELMQRFLSKQGFRVLTAANGEDGLRLARSKRPDAITLDVMMPGMDGWTVLSKLMADRDLADVPVVMLTIVDDKQNADTLWVRRNISPSRSTANGSSRCSTSIGVICRCWWWTTIRAFGCCCGGFSRRRGTR